MFLGWVETTATSEAKRGWAANRFQPGGKRQPLKIGPKKYHCRKCAAICESTVPNRGLSFSRCPLAFGSSVDGRNAGGRVLGCAENGDVHRQEMYRVVI